MKTNWWMRSGGFYWNGARIISDAWLDIAAHPRVLLKQVETARIKTEEATDKYREKMLKLAWTSRWFNHKIWDPGNNIHLVQMIMKKLKSGWVLTPQEAELFFELLKSEIIQSWWVKSDKTTKTISLGYELWPDIADIFEDTEEGSTVTNTLKEVEGILKETEIEQEIWIEALKCCRDTSFKPNIKAMNSTVVMEELVLRLKNPIILLRYHGLTMEAYRGTNEGNDGWISENWPDCISCGEEMAGSQNFTRVYWAGIHTSCIPDYLGKNRVDQKHGEYIRAVYEAMFPKRAETKE